MKLIFFIFFLGINFCDAQESFINSHDDIYIKEGLIYKVKDDELFTGTIHFSKKNGVIVLKEVYKEGYIANEYEYFNKSASSVVSKEIVYFKEKAQSEGTIFKKQKIILYHTNGEAYSITYFDFEGNIILKENFKNSKLTYSCEFKNGKKNGKEVCVYKNDEIVTTQYANGKKI